MWRGLWSYCEKWVDIPAKMNDDQQRDFIRRLYCITALVVAVVSVGLATARQWSFLAGFVAGALIAALMLYGVVLLSEAMTRRPQDNSPGRSLGGKVVALQVGKYTVAIGALYVLITFTHTSGVGIAVGYGTALAVLLLTGMRMRPNRKKICKDTEPDLERNESLCMKK